MLSRKILDPFETFEMKYCDCWYAGGGLTVGLWNLKMCRELYRSKFGRALLSTAGENESLRSRMDCGAPDRPDEREPTDKGYSALE